MSEDYRTDKSYTERAADRLPCHLPRQRPWRSICRCGPTDNTGIKSSRCTMHSGQPSAPANGQSTYSAIHLGNSWKLSSWHAPVAHVRRITEMSARRYRATAIRTSARIQCVNQLKIDWWQTKGSQAFKSATACSSGKRVTLKAADIVALAEVVRDRVRSDEGNPYHRIHDKSSIKAQRVGVSYIPLKNYLWSGRTLNEAECYRRFQWQRPGGTVFTSRLMEWSQVVAAAGRQNLSEAVDIDADIDEVRRRRNLHKREKEALGTARAREISPGSVRTGAAALS